MLPNLNTFGVFFVEFAPDGIPIPGMRGSVWYSKRGRIIFEDDPTPVKDSQTKFASLHCQPQQLVMLSVQ